MVVAQRVDPNLQRNGRCFICGKVAEVKPDRDHATGYGCGDSGRYDLVEKDRALVRGVDRRRRPPRAAADGGEVAVVHAGRM